MSASERFHSLDGAKLQKVGKIFSLFVISNFKLLRIGIFILLLRYQNDIILISNYMEQNFNFEYKGFKANGFVMFFVSLALIAAGV